MVNQKGETVLYVRLQNVLYGILKGALLFCRKLTNDLYDPCVAN